MEKLYKENIYLHSKDSKIKISFFKIFVNKCKIEIFIDLALSLFLQNPVEMVKRLAKFLNVDVSEQLCQDIAEACSFQKMVEASKAKRNLEGPCFAIDIQMYRKGKTLFLFCISQAEVVVEKIKSNFLFFAIIK